MATALMYMEAVKRLNKEPYVSFTVLNANIQKVKKKLILTREHKTCGNFLGKPLFPSNGLTGESR